MAVTMNFKDKVTAIAAGIEHLIKTAHQCQDKDNCSFSIAVFAEISDRVFKHNTLDEIAKAYEGMEYCDNAKKVLDGQA